MASAWVYQRQDQVRELGEGGAVWYVGWLEPDGRRKCKSCGPGPGGRRNPDKLRRKLESELMTGTYQKTTTVLWDDFVKEYDERILSRLALGSRAEALASLRHFRRLVKPVRVF